MPEYDQNTFIQSNTAGRGFAFLAVSTLSTPPAKADEPTRAVNSEGDKTIELPLSQTWTGNGRNETVAYTLSPANIAADSGISIDTGQAVANGWISWDIDGESEANPKSTIISGNSKKNIVFTWNKPGLYVLDLSTSAQDTEACKYDHSTFRIRVYVNTKSQFITVERLDAGGATSEGTKIGTIIFNHVYSGDDDGADSDGDSSRNKEPELPDNPTSTAQDNVNNNPNGTEISERGDQNNQGSKNDGDQGGISWGNLQTGDASNADLYAIVCVISFITVVAWMAKRNKYENKHNQN